MRTQHWPLSELRDVDRAARKIIVENGGKHPASCSLTSLLYLPREKVGRGLPSVEHKYKITKIKSLLKLYQNRMRWEDESLSITSCFAWLKGWATCPTHTIAGMYELYEQLLPTKLYTKEKTQTSTDGEVLCRLCGKVAESIAHVLAGCSSLAQTKYLYRNNAALKILFLSSCESMG